MNVMTLLATEDPTRTHSWIWPEGYELYFGGAASIFVFALLFKFAGPTLKKGMSDRTARIQKQLDDAANAMSSAQAEAIRIREAKGDIGSERARLLAEADTQAQQLLVDGRARLEVEIVDLETKAVADNVAASGRIGDELRAEVARLSIAAVDHVVSGSLDAATHQELIENFIVRVGAGR